MANNCIIPTPELKELSKKLGIDQFRTNYQVMKFNRLNNKEPEYIPTVEEIKGQMKGNKGIVGNINTRFFPTKNINSIENLNKYLDSKYLTKEFSIANVNSMTDPRLRRNLVIGIVNAISSTLTDNSSQGMAKKEDGLFLLGPNSTVMKLNNNHLKGLNLFALELSKELLGRNMDMPIILNGDSGVNEALVRIFTYHRIPTKVITTGQFSYTYPDGKEYSSKKNFMRRFSDVIAEVSKDLLEGDYSKYPKRSLDSIHRGTSLIISVGSNLGLSRYSKLFKYKSSPRNIVLPLGIIFPKIRNGQTYEGKILTTDEFVYTITEDSIKKYRRDDSVVEDKSNPNVISGKGEFVETLPHIDNDGVYSPNSNFIAALYDTVTQKIKSENDKGNSVHLYLEPNKVYHGYSGMDVLNTIVKNYIAKYKTEPNLTLDTSFGNLQGFEEYEETSFEPENSTQSENVIQKNTESNSNPNSYRKLYKVAKRREHAINFAQMYKENFEGALRREHTYYRKLFTGKNAARYNELRAKETLTEEEAKELKELRLNSRTKAKYHRAIDKDTFIMRNSTDLAQTVKRSILNYVNAIATNYKSGNKAAAFDIAYQGVLANVKKAYGLPDSYIVEKGSALDVYVTRLTNNKVNFALIVSENFDDIYKESLALLEDSLGVSVKIVDRDFRNEREDDETPESRPKEGWMVDSYEANNYDSTTFRTKRILGNLLQVNIKGVAKLNSIGGFQYLPSKVAFGILVNELTDYFTVDTFKPALVKLSSKYPWVKKLIADMDNDPQLANNLYTALKLQHNRFIKIAPDLGTRVGRDGTVHKSSPVIMLNSKDIVKSLSDNWMGGMSIATVAVNGIITKNSIEEAEKLLSNYSSNKNVNTLSNALSGVGIEMSPEELSGLTKLELDSIYSKLYNILFTLKSKGMDKKVEDVLKLVRKNYTGIAKIAAKVSQINRTESNIKVKSKNRYTKSKNSFVNELFAKLNRGDISIEEYSQFLDKFRDYGWYSNSEGSFLNPILNYIEHKLDMLRIEGKTQVPSDYFSFYVYSQLLDSLDNENKDSNSKQRIISRLAAYFSDISIEGNKNVLQYIFNYADSDNVDYVSLPKKTKAQAKEDIINMIISELNRIRLVEEREAVIKENPNKEIKSFDTRGKSFVLFPYLNNTIYKNQNTGEEVGLYEKYFNTPINDRMDLLSGVADSLIEHYILKADVLFVRNDITDSSTTDNLPFIRNLKRTNSELIVRLNHIREFIKVKGIQSESLLTSIDKLLHRFNVVLMSEDYNALLNDVKRDLGEVIGIAELESSVNAVNNAELNLEMVEELTDAVVSMAANTAALRQLLNVDPALYSSSVDEQKREKQAKSPTSKLNTTKPLRSIYLSDVKRPSTTLSDIISIIDRMEGWSKQTKNKIKDSLSKINVGDGQSFRTLDSYIRLLELKGGLTEQQRDAIEKIRTKQPLSIAERTVVFQSIKGFAYGTREENVTTTRDGNTSNKKLIINAQYKNSESPLLALMQLMEPSKVDPKFSKLLEWLDRLPEDSKVDIIHFDSSVKVGNSKGNLNLETTNLVDIEGELNQRYKDGTLIKELDPEFYGIQNETPEHLVDVEIGMGIQIRKLILSDIIDTNIYTIDDKQYTGSEIKKLYNHYTWLYHKHQIDKLRNKLGSVQDLSKFLKKKVMANLERYGIELYNALDVVKEGNVYKFKDDLINPLFRDKLEALLASVVRRDVVEHRFKGGTGILVSDIWIDESQSLKVKYAKDSNGNDYIEYVEAYMPAYTSKIFEKYMREDGTIDMKDIQDDNLLKAVGYRVPTEAKYSMANIRIKGFLPKESGSSVILPADFVVFAGWDFK